LTDAPLIGISTYRQPADWSSWKGVRADLLPSAYAESVTAAGGVPVLIPPLPSATSACTVIARLDGLIISGGADVNPARYGEVPDENVSVWYDDRDASELWLLDAAKDASLPVLGICRGMQIMAVHAGGRLVQHLPDVVGHAMHAGNASGYSHLEVTVEPGHRITELIGPRVIAACHHHQAVATHPGFVATAHDLDGVLQAMESESDRFELAVQWHPETAADGWLLAGLVAAAKSFASGR
jgi:putative glutamine amidotransferase